MDRRSFFSTCVSAMLLLAAAGSAFGTSISSLESTSGVNVGLQVSAAPSILGAFGASNEKIGFAPLAGDANLDNIVDQADYTVWYNNFGYNNATWTNGDFNSDQIVDQADYTIWYNNYGRTNTKQDPSSPVVPEPLTLGGLALGLAACSNYLRRRLLPQPG